MTLWPWTDWEILVCYLICLLAAVGHLLNGHHLIIAHISGLMEDNNTDVRKTSDTKRMDLHKCADCNSSLVLQNITGRVS